MAIRSTLNTSRDYEKASDNALKSAEKKLNLAEEQALALEEIEKGKVNLEKAIRETTDPTEKQNLINALESYQNNVLNPAQIKVSETLASVTQDLENSRQLDDLAEKAATPPEMPILPDLPGALVPRPAMVPDLASQNPGDPTAYSNPLPEYGPNKPAGAPELIPTTQQPVIATVKPRSPVTTPDQTQPESVTITKTLDEPQAPTSEPVENTGVVQTFAVKPQANITTTITPDESSIVRISNPTAEQIAFLEANSAVIQPQQTVETTEQPPYPDSGPIVRAQKTAENYARPPTSDIRILSESTVDSGYPGSGAILSEDGTQIVTGIRKNLETGETYEVPLGSSGPITRTTKQNAPQRQATTDLRFRISLAPNANYMYNIATQEDILYPLNKTRGVIFPYTPQIAMVHSAHYEPTEVVHSNYKLYNYRNSSIDNISITADFTAQDTFEANYLLAVIHFFKSVTKMFYGLDTNPRAGTPPPICFITGYGKYAFNNHPVLISSFSMTYPTDVDYINAGASAISGQQLTNYRPPIAIGTTYRERLERLKKSGLSPGGVSSKTPFTSVNNFDNITRVPTKLQITLNAIPIITRYTVSNAFSLKNYATGKLLQGNDRFGGVW